MHPPSVRDDPAQSSPTPLLKAADRFRMGIYNQWRICLKAFQHSLLFFSIFYLFSFISLTASFYDWASIDSDSIRHGRITGKIVNDGRPIDWGLPPVYIQLWDIYTTTVTVRSCSRLSWNIV